MAWMEPHPGVGYDEVPWYRKTWFFMVLLFTIWPLTLAITLTGDLFQKANRRQRNQSDAEVWRSTGSGRAVMIVSGVVIGALASVQYWQIYSNRETASAQPRTQVAAEPVVEETTTTTLATTTTTLPDSEGLPEYLDALQALGAAGFAAKDPTEAIALLSDRFGTLPAAGQMSIRDFSVATADHTEGQATYRARVSYLTDLSVAEAAEIHRPVALLEIPLTGEETSATDLGQEIELEYKSIDSPHPDPDVWLASSRVTIEDTEDGVTVSISSSISWRDQPLADADLQTQLVALLPLADGYENDATSIGFLTIEPYADAPTFSLSVETTSTQPLASTDDAAEAARFAEVAETGGLWTLKDTTDTGVSMERLDGQFDGTMFISGNNSDSHNIVRTSLRIS